MKKKPAKSKAVDGPQAAGDDLVAIAGGVRAPRAEVAHIIEDLWPLTVEIDLLTPDPRNARVHPEKNKAAIRGLLSSLGQQKPISVDKWNIILAGNGTWEQAKALGWKYLARVRSNLEGEKARLWAVGDNRSTELSEWDRIELGTTMQSISDAGLDLSGFDLESLVSDLDLTALAEGDFESAHAFARPAEKPPKKERAKKNGGKLLLIAHFTSEAQQREWGDKLMAAGIDVEFRRG